MTFRTNICIRKLAGLKISAKDLATSRHVIGNTLVGGGIGGVLGYLLSSTGPKEKRNVLKQIGATVLGAITGAGIGLLHGAGQYKNDIALQRLTDLSTTTPEGSLSSPDVPTVAIPDSRSIVIPTYTPSSDSYNTLDTTIRPASTIMFGGSL